MARFCSNCGSPVADGLLFCTGCGSPVAQAPKAAAAPMQPSAASQAAPTPVAAPAAGAPAKQGSSALKVVLIVLLTMFLVGTAAVGACFVIAYRFKNRMRAQMQQSHTTLKTGQGPGEVRIETGGSAKTAQAATADIPPYPGSTPTNQGVSIGGPQGGVSGQEFETADPVDKVVAFYKNQLGPKANESEAGEKTTFTIFTDNGISSVEISRDESAGKTKINIGHLGK